jgi:hypothetical protein
MTSRKHFPLFLFLAAVLPFIQAQQPNSSQHIPLPTSKMLSVPSPGTDSFPATIAISPDGRYAALLNDATSTGLGPPETGRSRHACTVVTPRSARFGAAFHNPPQFCTGCKFLHLDTPMQESSYFYSGFIPREAGISRFFPRLVRRIST